MTSDTNPTALPEALTGMDLADFAERLAEHWGPGWTLYPYMNGTHEAYLNGPQRQKVRVSPVGKHRVEVVGLTYDLPDLYYDKNAEKWAERIKVSTKRSIDKIAAKVRTEFLEGENGYLAHHKYLRELRDRLRAEERWPGTDPETFPSPRYGTRVR
ncbi:hypothetical protein [Nocardia sp. XZ_19_369]|uniref:hypothetical protein n=1 Tax=Nocardia sp. XZ_19_369 TaxID=2769487 RepID=UPI00188EE66A|nr:hypothetical protein [Nocardia sp. XZ_19_369]